MPGSWGSKNKGHIAALTPSGGGGGWGSAYAAGSEPQAPAVPSNGGHHGVTGFVENLGSDIGHSIEGLPAGLLQTVTHPIRTAQQVGKSYEQTYGPLVHGHVSEFLHQLYSHPLGPIMDAATVLSLGAAGLERAGLAPEIAKDIEVRSPRAIVGQDESDVFKRPITGGPLQRAVKLGAHAAALKVNRLATLAGHDLPIGNEALMAGKELRHLPRQKYLQGVARMRDYSHAFKRLSPEEQAALHLIGRGVHPIDYKNFLKTQGHVEPTMLRVLDNPKIIQAFENPSDKLHAAVQAAKKLSKIDAEAKIARGVLSPETAAKRLGLHERLVYGNEAGRAQFYVPDTAAVEGRSSLYSRAGGGTSVPKRTGSMMRNEGVNFRTGRLALNSDLLGQTYLETLRFGLKDDIHAALTSHAVRIDADDIHRGGVPRGWSLIPKKLISDTGNARPQAISSTVRKSGALKRGLTYLLPEGDDASSFITTDPGMAERVHGDYLIAPTSLVRELVGEYSKSNAVIRTFIERPTKVWRALVLGGRIGFLTNNVVGNHLVFAIHAAGIDGLRSYLNAVKRAKGTSVVRSLIQDRAVPPAMRQELMDSFFPEQVEGTFGKTQRPEPGSFAHTLDQNPVTRTLRKASTGVAPVTQAIAEGNLRRALVEFYIRKSPEFKEFTATIPKQTRDFETAARTLLNGKAGAAYQRRISLQVNQALGDYLNLGPLATIARGVFPFSAWYKAILSISGHLALETPGRTDILLKLGSIGTKSAQNELASIYGGAANVPGYMLDELPLGGRKVIGTNGINPFQSLQQLGEGAGALLTGSPGATGKAFANLGPNPVLLAVSNNLAGKNLYTGRTETGGGPLVQTIHQIATDLPQVTLAKSLAGKGNTTATYGKQSGTAAVLSYLGVPLKRVQVGTR